MTSAYELDLVGLVTARLRERIDESAAPIVEAALRLGDSDPPRLPAIVVFLAADELTPSAAPAVGALQRVTATLAVVHIIEARNTRRAAGGEAVDPMAAFAGRTRGAINGWKPREDARQDALQLLRGRLIDIDGGRAVWQDEYTVSWRARSIQD